MSDIARYPYVSTWQSDHRATYGITVHFSEKEFVQLEVPWDVMEAGNVREWCQEQLRNVRLPGRELDAIHLALDAGIPRVRQQFRLREKFQMSEFAEPDNQPRKVIR